MRVLLLTKNRISSFISHILSKNIKETYSALSNEEPERPSTPEDEKSNTNNTKKEQEQKQLMNQCFIYILLATIFIIATTTTIVLSGTAKCRAHTPSNTTNPVPIFVETPLNSQKEHQKALAMFQIPKTLQKMPSHVVRARMQP